MAFDVHASGLYPIAPTPFHADGRVDLDSVARVMELYLKDAQRKPTSSLTAAARAEVDFLLARLARRDPRTAL